MRKTHSFILLAQLLTALPALAQSLTIQGKVMDGANDPITGNATQFRVQILSPAPTKCILFDETHTIDLSASNGFFSINLNDGNGTLNPTSAVTLDRAVSNYNSFSVNPANCASGGGTYSPGVNDNRIVVIQFMDPGSMTGFEVIPEMDLNPMAYAMESRSISGFPATSLLRVVGGGVPGTAPTLTAADVAELQALVAGTSTKYTTRTAGNGAQLPTYSGAPASPTAGSMWYDSSDGTMKYYDGTTVQTIGSGGGGGGGSLPTATSGQFLKSGGGTTWAGANITLSDLKSTNTGNLFVSPGCTAAVAPARCSATTARATRLPS